MYYQTSLYVTSHCNICLEKREDYIVVKEIHVKYH